ncbi:MAG: N-acetylneuraminate synthase [Candidatus Scalindua sp.]|jgi:N,N'-diacetyllegionaminate synthase|nr:N-acetylneuraminate synthase [Candidatus Scalindua sp.]MBT6049922.1 N-acetylneuraminate synthase [Candidatus Scalindua sp.]MBT6226185.1 N-acetylneuraminate synthase [Candidatus Scalindua sp.]
MKKEKIFIIAEAGVNHNGDLLLAFKMIDKAVESGADAIKFQSFVAESLVTEGLDMSDYQKENMQSDITQFEMLKRLEIGNDKMLKMIEYADSKNIMLFSTPFDRDSVDFLVKTRRPFIKIDSGAITDIPFLEYVSKQGIPLIISTGGATMEEVRETVDIVSRCNDKITLLHCTSIYPAKYDEVNLLAMKEMMKEFACPIGYSDHSLGIEVSIAAAALGAVVIEKHFTLDKALEGPDHKASIEPHELQEMITSIRNVEKALGHGKKIPLPEEERNMLFGRRSIIAAEDLNKGDRITEDKVVIKRPGTGLLPKYLKTVIGKRVLRDIEYDSPIMETDIERIKSDR